MKNNRKLIPLNIQKFSEEIEAGTTIQVNGNATLTDVDTTKESRVLRLLGQTSQNGTPTPDAPIPVNVVSGDNEINICGKNLYNTTLKQGGYSFTTGNFFNSPSYVCTIDKIRVNSGETYILSFKGNSNNYGGMGFIYFYNDTYIGYSSIGQNKITIPSGINQVHFNIYNPNGITPSTLYDIQLEKGSTTTTYEPYIGNSYPLYLGVENLINNMRTTTSINGLTFTVNSDGSVLVNGTATAATSFITCDQTQTNIRSKLLNKMLTLSGCPSGGSSSTYRLQIWGTGTGTFYDYGNSSTFSFTNSSSNWNVAIYIANGQTINNLLFKPMVEEGSKANHYTPYGTTPIFLGKIGTYQDYIYKDNGSWYLHKEIGKDKLSSSNVVYHGVDNYKYQFEFTPSQTSIAKQKIYSTHFYNNSTTQWWTIDNNIYLNGASVVYITSTQYTSITAFNNFTSTNDVYVYYPLATPIDIPIEDTNLIEQLESLSS